MTEAKLPCRLLFVCKDCGRDGGDLKKWVKKRLKGDDRRSEIRVVRTECMGLCPEDDQVSVAVVSEGQAGACLAVDARKDRERLYLKVLETVG